MVISHYPLAFLYYFLQLTVKKAFNLKLGIWNLKLEI